MRWLTSAVLCLIVCGPAHLAVADTPDEVAVRGGPKEYTRKIRASQRRAIAWLRKAQNADGSWGLEPGAKPDLPCTCVAILALMGDGSTMSRGKHSVAIRKGLAWVSRRAKAHKYKIPRDRESHISVKLGTEIQGFLITLLCAEAHGKEDNRDLQNTLNKTLRSMVATIGQQQRDDGSWNSQVFAPLLATGSAWMALRVGYMSGANAGKSSADKTLGYVLNKIDKNTGVIGGAHRGGRDSYRFFGQAVGLRVLFGMGMGESKIADKAVDALFKHGYKPYDRSFISEGENYMAAWYSTQALFGERRKGKPRYHRWYKRITTTLLDCQNADGSWRGTACITSRVFSTACASLTLTVPLRFLHLTEY